MFSIDTIVHFLPNDKKIKVKSGTTLLRAARSANIAIVTRCGGNASCLMCKVKIVDQNGVTPPSSAELYKLGALIEVGTRLACQTKVCQSITAVLPDDPLRAAVAKQLQKQDDDKLW